MAAMASSARDIPNPFARDSFAAVAARSVPASKTHPLPTPPNSISPNLPPHNKPYGTRSATQATLEPIDSDLELQDVSGSDKETSSEKDHHVGSPGLDTTGAITPALLAKHYLPEILLNHGPLAIRHIMGYLTTSVPGFPYIQPAKARRLVVGALEGRGSGGEGGGPNGDVKFEKVGWGRWDAKVKGQNAGNSRRQRSPPPSAPSSYSQGLAIPGNSGRTRLNLPESSWAGESAVFSHDDDTDIKMSLDGDESCSSSSAAEDEDEIMEDDPDDVTDDEDWAALGAAALRSASYSASGLNSRLYKGRTHSGGGPSPSLLTKSVPKAMPMPTRPAFHSTQSTNNIDFSAYGMTSDSQEREAVEALLRLRSV